MDYFQGSLFVCFGVSMDNSDFNLIDCVRVRIFTQICFSTIDLVVLVSVFHAAVGYIHQHRLILFRLVSQ